MMVAYGEDALGGGDHDDDAPDNRWDQQSSDARVEDDLWEAVCVDVAPGWVVDLGKIPLEKVRPV